MTWPRQVLQPGLCFVHLPAPSPASPHLCVCSHCAPLWGIHLRLPRALSSSFDLCPGRCQSLTRVTMICQGAHHGRNLS